MTYSLHRWLFVSLSLSLSAACAGAAVGPEVQAPPAPTSTTTGSGTLAIASSVSPSTHSTAAPTPASKSALPSGTVFQISAEASVAASPARSGPAPNDKVAYYRVARDPSGSFFWLGSFSENGQLIAAGRDVKDADVAAVLAVVRKNAAALRCDPAAGRAPYISRRIDVEGELNVHVQSDCRGVYPDESAAPAEYRAFKQAMREVEQTMLAFVKRFMPPPPERERECMSNEDCPGQVCVQRSACACGGAAQRGAVCRQSFPKCSPCSGPPRP